MALNKQPVPISFQKGIDTKSDPYQLAVGTFASLTNSVFDKVGRLTKRNGFKSITSLPNASQTQLTTLNDNLIATGSALYAYSQDTNQWLNRGSVQPVDLNVLPLLRSSTSQTAPDSVTAPNGLVCLAYMDSGQAYWQLSDSTTGQQVVNRTALPTTATNPRVFLLGNYFAISYMATVAGSTALQLLAISSTNLATIGTVTVSGTVKSLTTGYDGVILAGQLYLAWSASSTAIELTYVTPALTTAAPVTIASHTADLMSLSADQTNSMVWLSYWDATSTNGFTAAYTQILAPIPASAQQIIFGASLKTITSAAQNLTNTVMYEVSNTFSAPYPQTGVQSDFINGVTSTSLGSVTQLGTVVRSVGLASKAFVGPNGVIYMLAAYGEANQPTYFLIDTVGAVYMRLAYENGGGFATSQVLPSISSLGNNSYSAVYLYKDFLATVNKLTNITPGQQSNAIYTQTGVNLATFSINTTSQYSSEIAGALHLTGGQLWEYDGVRPVEHGFHVWPEDVQAVYSTTGGAIVAQPSGYVSGVAPYYYQAVYEWTDNQGNLHRSAPSIPFPVTTSGTGTTGVCSVFVPTLRLTRKLSPNPVRIVLYRWSVAQQVYYQVTSITSPIINDPTVDYIAYTDKLSDAQILGNTLLYTTGGVVEDIAAPACAASCLYKNRLILVDAEDRNLLWYSKQVIEAVPVEMSDLLTIYVAPTSGAQGSTGPVTALSAMDDKLIIFKRDAIYYITGTGPDNTGANNDFSDPVYITSSVGCANPDSIVLMPNGIMFQSAKGIWILGRDLTTSYIGAAVEDFNSHTVVSAQNIPNTNQVRFVLDNSQTLMYDYFVGQWGTHTNLSAVSATIYQASLTYLNSFGMVFQEAPGTYVDGSTPVLMSFTTSWINLAGLQGFERFYEMYLLGTYVTPFKIAVGVAFDYNPSLIQNTIVTPDNASGQWGSDPVWGSSAGWAKSNVFEARVFPNQQKCQSFQITVSELISGTVAGQGLSMSGLNLIVGAKRGWRTQKGGRSFG